MQITSAVSSSFTSAPRAVSRMAQTQAVVAFGHSPNHDPQPKQAEAPKAQLSPEKNVFQKIGDWLKGLWETITGWFTGKKADEPPKATDAQEVHNHSHDHGHGHHDHDCSSPDCPHDHGSDHGHSH